MRRNQAYRAQKRNEKRIARTGPSLPETLRLLAPLASTLEQLNLGYNKLGGTITPDIAAFTKLTKLGLSHMGLEGASLGLPSVTARRSELRVACIARAGPIPVELLRWKFVEGRTVELKDNEGLELPSNIGELSDGVTSIDLSKHNLRGL